MYENVPAIFVWGFLSLLLLTVVSILKTAVLAFFNGYCLYFNYQFFFIFQPYKGEKARNSLHMVAHTAMPNLSSCELAIMVPESSATGVEAATTIIHQVSHYS